MLDLTTFLSGPYATQVLADLGADVVKVEPPVGDSSRAIPPYFVGEDSAYFLSVNRNKRSITVDLRQDEGRRLLNELADAADVVIEDFRPGVIDRLGLSYEQLSTRRPEVVVLDQRVRVHRPVPGPARVRHDRSGHVRGHDRDRDDGPVARPLRGSHRRPAGRDVRRDRHPVRCPRASGHVYHLLAGVEPGRQGRGHDSIPTYRTFTGSDDVDVIVTAITEPMWRSLCQVLEVPGLVDDPRFVGGDGTCQPGRVMFGVGSLSFC